MPKVRVIRAGLVCREDAGKDKNGKERKKLVVYKVGDVLEVSDRQFKKCKDKLELASETIDITSSEDDGQKTIETKFDLEMASRDELFAKAEKLGIESKPQWGDKRLREAIAEALDELEEE